MSTIQLVKRFHKVFKRPINDTIILYDDNLNSLRLRLLREEVDELEEGLEDRNPIEVLDALTDIQYVLDGAYLSFGFYKFKEAAFQEVHWSNMTKLDGNGKPIIREDGKIIKGPNYIGPNLARVLRGGV